MPETYLIHCPACGIANRVPAATEGRPGRCGNCHKTLAPLYVKPLALTEEYFDTFVGNYPGPILAEFWAPWCPHCRNFAPVVHEVARELAGTGVVVQVNIQENPRLADRFGVRNIPTVLILRRGQVIKPVNGALDRDSLLAWWKRHSG